MAEQLLVDFEAMLVQHRAHREQMLAENAADPLRPTKRGPGTARPRGSRSPRKD
jgi:hypothetical protein